MAWLVLDCGLLADVENSLSLWGLLFDNSGREVSKVWVEQFWFGDFWVEEGLGVRELLLQRGVRCRDPGLKRERASMTPNQTRSPKPKKPGLKNQLFFWTSELFTTCFDRSHQNKYLTNQGYPSHNKNGQSIILATTKKTLLTLARPAKISLSKFKFSSPFAPFRRTVWRTFAVLLFLHDLMTFAMLKEINWWSLRILHTS